jgi:hypothetical protein
MTDQIVARPTPRVSTGRVDSEEFQIDSVPLLDEAGCQRLRDDLFAIRDLWEARHAELPFFTLGAASYLDASKGRFAEYQEKARRFNPILREHFGWFYDLYAETLAEYSGMPCVYDDALALPGFHVFLGHQEGESSGHRHFDLQCDNLDWSSYGWVDPSLQLSCTLPVRLPPSGGGMYVWNVNDRVIARLSAEERKAHLAANQNPTYQAYETGAIAVHSGHYLHQIARLRGMQPGDERITLQAHAVATDRGWVLYW